MSSVRRSTILFSLVSGILLLLGTVVLWTTNRLFQNYQLESQLRATAAEQIFNAQQLALTSAQLRHQPQADSLWNQLMEKKEDWSEKQVAFIALLTRIGSRINTVQVNSEPLIKSSNYTRRVERLVNQLFLDFDDKVFNQNIEDIQFKTRAYTVQTSLIAEKAQVQLGKQTKQWTKALQWQAAALIISAITGIALFYTEAIRNSGNEKKATLIPPEFVKQNHEVRLKHSLNIQKTINDNLRNAKKSAEEISQAKGKFLSMLSHEIRNPVNAILGISHFLIDEPHSEDQAENLRSLHFSAEHLRKLVDNILDLGKIEADRVELVESPFDLVQLSRGVMNSYRGKAEEKEVALKLEFDPQIPSEIAGDSLRISQILNNIVSNSVKFTLQGEIRLNLVIVEEDFESILIGFRIEDTGIGVHPDKIPTLFDEFTQAQSTTTQEYGGTGLGLAITKRLVELHGGEIRVESELHCGSTFSFELRFAKHAAEENLLSEDNLTEQLQQNLRNLRVLAAEDDRLNKNILQRFLRKWNASFDIVDNGALAVQLAENKSYDVILMDLNMPVMDGKTAVRTIRQKNKSIPVVALTGSTEQGIKQELINDGFTAVATKPFVPQEIFSILSSYLPTEKQV